MAGMQVKVNGAWEDWATSGGELPTFQASAGTSTYSADMGDLIWSAARPVYPETMNGNGYFKGMGVTRVEYPPPVISDARQMFDGCAYLVEAPMMDTSATIYFSEMFQGCKSLTEVPAYDYRQAGTFTRMFSGCTSLTEVPDIVVTGPAISTSSMFDRCTSLVEAPVISARVGGSYMFRNCSSLVEVPAYDMSGATGLRGFFDGCTSLERVQAFGFRDSVSVAGTKMGTAALNEFFTNLGTPADSTKKVTITGTPGAAKCDRSIATAKGWTVVG